MCFVICIVFIYIFTTMKETKKYMVNYWKQEISKRENQGASKFKIKLAKQQLKNWINIKL